MMGAATRLWTCDKCGDTATCMAESTPPAWRVVSANYMPDKGGGDYRGDWCGACVATLKKRNSRDGQTHED